MPLRYEAPETVDAAVHLLAAGGSDARVLAGGTDLLVQMQSGAHGIEGPPLIVDVKRIPRLMAITLDDEGLRLGAAVCCARIGEHAELKRLFPGLAEAADLIGSTQIQGRASLGGNLCNASPAADTVPALIALDARARIAGPDGDRELPVAEFVTAPGRNRLGPGELLAELFVPRPAPRSADAYLRFIPRTEMDIAVVGAGVSLGFDSSGTCTAARVALGAVAPTPIEAPAAAAALIGTRLDDAALDAAAAAASAAARPISDKRAPADYRKRVAGVLTKRAAQAAAARARAGNGNGA